jgi:hypothetical protein
MDELWDILNKGKPDKVPQQTELNSQDKKESKEEKKDNIADVNPNDSGSDLLRPKYKIEWSGKNKVELIEIKIRKINQLFNSFDPSPFLEKDLDDDAFEYIVSSVGEHSLKTKQKIIIYMPRNQQRKVSEHEIRRAIHHFFEYKSLLADRSIKLKLQEGQLSFVIGIIFLASCLLIRELIISRQDNLAISILAEGLIIGGWVAMWKPISNILYDWWPVRKERQVYDKISKMDIEFKYL